MTMKGYSKVFITDITMRNNSFHWAARQIVAVGEMVIGIGALFELSLFGARISCDTNHYSDWLAERSGGSGGYS